jgi:PKD repeat protein
MKPILLNNNFLKTFCFSCLFLFSLQSSFSCTINASLDFWVGNNDSTYQFWANAINKPGIRKTWNFGDGGTGSGIMVNHAYLAQGKYTINLYLWDSVNNCGDTITRELCYYSFTDQPSFQRSGDTVKASVTCVPNTVYRWNFDDGIFGFGCSTAHVYAKKGLYKPKLQKVTDTALGCLDSFYLKESAQGVMNFTKCGFTAEFYHSATTGGTMNTHAYPFSYHLGSTTKPGKDIWYWGDGDSSRKPFISGISQGSHAYDPSGLPNTFTVCHILTDSSGTCSDTACENIFVDTCSAIADFSYVLTGRQLTFTNKSTAFNYKWDFGGGTGNSNATNPTATYTTNGVYKVCLEANRGGCSKTICKNILVWKCEKPNYVSPSFDTRNCFITEFKNFNPWTNKYFWDFGDSTSSNLKSPFHKFPRNGSYQVKLVAGYDTLGISCKDSITFTLGMNCNYCGIRDSLVLEYDSTRPYEATLKNYTYNLNPSGVIHKHHWDFGDGTTSDSAEPVHTYTKTGYIKVKYTAKDTISGCVDTAVIIFTIDTNGRLKRNVFKLNVIDANKKSSIASIDPAGSGMRSYPNPFRHEIVLEGATVADIRTVMLYNTLGMQVELPYAIDNGRCLARTPEHLPPGLYILQVSTSAGLISIKLQKE